MEPIGHIVVVGAGGRLGSALVRDLTAAGHQLTALTRADLDVTDAAMVAAVVGGLRPEVVINCTAYNAVDGAERDREAAFAVNAAAPAALADAARAARALLVHYSTDFVFDGESTTPYAEDAPVNPLGVYGASKAAGEDAVRSRLERHYILRLASVFGGCPAENQRATIDVLADALWANLPARAAEDRTVSPSYVPDVVEATRALIAGGAPYGTYHCVASGSTTWYELANMIRQRLRSAGRVVPVRAADLPAVARRPRYCALSNGKLRDVGIEMPPWPVAVERHLEERYPAIVGMLSEQSATHV